MSGWEKFIVTVCLVSCVGFLGHIGERSKTQAAPSTAEQALAALTPEQRKQLKDALDSALNEPGLKERLEQRSRESVERSRVAFERLDAAKEKLCWSLEKVGQVGQCWSELRELRRDPAVYVRRQRALNP